MPGFSVGSQFTMHALDRTAGKGKSLNAETQLDGKRQRLRAGEIAGQLLDGGERPDRISCGNDTPGRDRVAALKHPVKLWLAPKSQFGATAQLDRTVARPVLKFDLLKHCSRAIALDARGEMPRRVDEVSGRGTVDRASERDAAFEARRPTLDPDREIDVSP